VIYGIENATQRGTDSTAVVGTVAGAMRIIAKALLVGDLSGFHERLSKRGFEVAAGQLVTARGIGEPIVTEFLAAVPGMDSNTVKQQGAGRSRRPSTNARAPT
jgi:hypothetical protein